MAATARTSPLEFLRTDRVGGALLLLATALALICANSPLSEAYLGVRGHHLGGTVAGLDLDLSIGHWAADGLLAVFFFLAGLELKQEFVAGDLRHPGRAVVPVAAAFGGVTVPAIIFALTNLADPDALRGWAIPTATDIAFALAVLAVIGSHLPGAMRTFLLTLAIVDDLIAIAIIAVFYTSDLDVGHLLATVVPVVVYGIVVTVFERFFRRHRWAPWAVLLPIGVVAWALLLNSGVHATIAGVALAFTVPVHPRGRDSREDGLAHLLEHHLRPLSSGVCVPLFAFFSAGVAIGGWSGLTSTLGSPIALGIVAGLVVGKLIGITGTTFLVTRFRGVHIDPQLAWVDIAGLGAVGGIGFTVSLLVSELSFGQGSPTDDAGKVGILTASLLAAVVSSAILVPRDRHYHQLGAQAQASGAHSGPVSPSDSSSLRNRGVGLASGVPTAIGRDSQRACSEA